MNPTLDDKIKNSEEKKDKDEKKDKKEKKDKDKKDKKELGNDINKRILLFHGTKAENVIGILNKGLLIAPIEAETSGNKYGNGIYLSDSFFKALNYSSGNGKIYVLVVDAFLERPFKISKKNKFNDVKTLKKKKFNCLITNMPLIEDKNNEEKNIIEFINNNKDILKLDLEKDKRFIYTFKGELAIDITMIEILPNDKVPEDLFLEPDLDYRDNYNELKEKEICSIQFTKEGEFKYSVGKIISITNTEFTHTASTLAGSSGSPIILKNSKKIIGIHKNRSINKQENYGDFLYPIIKLLEAQKKPINSYALVQNPINMNNSLIKEKIEKVVNRCINEEIYSNIMSDFFTKGIVKHSFYLLSLQILSDLTEDEMKNNFEKNIKRLIYCINNEIKPGLIIYNVLSCIYGAFYGDALGSFCELYEYDKNNHNKIFKQIPVFGGQIGQITDDSEMAMSLAYAIMDNPSKESLDVNYLYFYYGAWSKTDPLDIGIATRKAFENFDFVQYHPKKQGFKNIENNILNNNSQSLSNGFLMRKSTFIAWLFYRFYGEINKAFNEIKDTGPLLNLYKKIRDLSRIDNQCTHPNAEADVASSFYCIMGLGIICKLRPNNILYKLECLCQNEYFIKEGNENDKKFSIMFLKILNLFKSPNFDFYNFFGNKQSPNCVHGKGIGWYGHAFRLVIYYLLNYEKYEEKTGFETIMGEICDLGGDTDTNCCIVGGIIGPLFGIQNFGKNFKKSLELIPLNRDMFSIPLMIPYIIYLQKSNKDDEFIKDDRYFLRTILTLLYDEIDIDLT
mgnify:CR=1 FL=1